MSEQSRVAESRFIEEEHARLIREYGDGYINSADLDQRIAESLEEARGFVYDDETPMEKARRHGQRIRRKHKGFVKPILDRASKGLLPVITAEDPEWWYTIQLGDNRLRPLGYMTDFDFEDLKTLRKENKRRVDLAYEEDNRRDTAIQAAMQSFTTFGHAGRDGAFTYGLDKDAA